MTITRSNSGTVTADGTEQTLASPTAQGKYRLLVDLVNLVNGDIVELRVKVPALNGGTARTVYYAVYQNAQSADALMAISPELPVVDASAFTLKQTAGTNRQYPWAVVLDSDVASSVTGAVGSVASGGITSGSFAAGAINAAAVADGAIDAATFAAGAITATVIATGAIDADALAADAVAEIADGVWDEDATGHQTQGTFGQAIGDPGADADTIWGLANTNLDATMSSRASQATADAIETDTQDIQSRLPAALVSGRMDSNMQAAANGVITAAVIATDAIDADALADGAITAATFAAGAIDNTAFNVTETLNADVVSISGDTAAADNAEKYFDGTGYGLILQRTTIATLASQTEFTLTAGSADNNAYNECVIVIEDASTAAQKAIGVISDYVGASKTVTLLADPGIFTIATTDIVTILGIRAGDVWNVVLADHLAAGGTGNALNAAGAAGDPWSTALPGAYGAGTAGKIVGDNINATISSRASQTSVDTVDTVVDAILDDTGTSGVVVAAGSKTGYTLSAAGIQAIWDALTAALTTVGSVGKLLADNINATISSRLASASYTTPPTANENADALLDRADAIETGLTPRQSLRLNSAALAGKLSGAATATVTIRNAVQDSKARITATVDADGNRTAITTDVT